ncbi:MAG: hypothetical protein ABIT76_13630 [Chthoniobacterales bacterium]
MHPNRHYNASALIVVLAVIVLITVLAVTLLTVAKSERMSSSLNLARNQAGLFADFGADIALERIREGTEAGLQPRHAWASEPGRVHLFTMDASGQITQSAVDLFSGLPGADDPITKNLRNVDLNEPSFSGSYPIAASGNMKVGWIELTADPDVPPARNNPLVGRIAFWADDESCKVNINTADGSKKEDRTQSFGFGTPSEISLAGLPGSSQTIAAAIAKYATEKGFNSTAEVGRADSVPPGFFEENKFNITNYSRSPDLNIFGEPRIQLFPGIRTAAGETRNMMLGYYAPQGSPDAYWTDTAIIAASAPITHVYPTSTQLPPSTVTGSSASLGQYFVEFRKPNATQSFSSTSRNFPTAMRAAAYLAGQNSQNQAVIWPRFSGAAGGFSAKYTARQIDSITLQIHDIVASCWMADQGRNYTLPSIMPLGFRSSQLVSGIGRSPLFNEVYMEVSGTPSSVSGTPIVSAQFRVNVEMLFPRYYEGAPLQSPYGTDPSLWNVGNTSSPHTLNSQDRPTVTSSLTTADAALGGRWGDNLLRIQDGSSATAGFDLVGNPGGIPSGVADPDQAKAAAYHPYRLNAATTKYDGSLLGQTGVRPALTMTSMAQTTQSWYPGSYHAIANINRSFLYPSKPGLSSMKAVGGFALWSHNESSGTWRQIDFAPLESLRGPTYTAESATLISASILGAVLPVDFSVTSPGIGGYLLRVRDPLVNKNPGDWEAVPNPSSSEITMLANVTTSSYDRRGTGAVDANFPPGSIAAPQSFDGDNPGYKPSAGGDPLSLWLPRQDIQMPKLARFPSVGALNSVRTGILPDSGNAGTPWRSLSFTPTSGSGQATALGRYPDWAMLDLFTVPFLPQRPAVAGSGALPQIRMLTGGGSTEGRININNPRVPYPFGESVPGVSQTPPQRTAPLEALFFGIKASTQYDTSGESIQKTVNEKALAAGVQNYLASNGSMMIAGEISNIPEIAAYTYAGVDTNARSRNDVVRQIVGGLTTQSNVFSVWVVAQTIRKSPKNSDYGHFQAADSVTGEIRRRYVIERYIETGKDGVPGNSVNPGPDGIVNTEDDPIDADYHPAMTYPLPYRWRIVQVEDVPL